MKKTLLALSLLFLALPPAPAQAPRPMLPVFSLWGSKILGFISPVSYVCPDKQGTCEVPISVVPMVINGADDCVVTAVIGHIYTEKKDKPKVIWIIGNGDPNDSSVYEFDKDIGIEMDKSRNDETQDFKKHGHDGGKKHRFRWDSVNARAGGIDKLAYEIHVTRTYNGRTFPCSKVDPTITNRD